MEPIVLVQRFNEAFTRRDLAALTALITEDHRFVDACGGVVSGREACLAAWRRSFLADPDQRNRFRSVRCIGGAVVEAVGRCECADPALCGPAHWYAVVVGDRLAEWRVDLAA